MPLGAACNPSGLLANRRVNSSLVLRAKLHTCHFSVLRCCCQLRNRDKNISPSVSVSGCRHLYPCTYNPGRDSQGSLASEPQPWIVPVWQDDEHESLTLMCTDMNLSALEPLFTFFQEMQATHDPDEKKLFRHIKYQGVNKVLNQHLKFIIIFALHLPKAKKTVLILKRKTALKVSYAGQLFFSTS